VRGAYFGVFVIHKGLKQMHFQQETSLFVLPCLLWTAFIWNCPQSL